MPDAHDRHRPSPAEQYVDLGARIFAAATLEELARLRREIARLPSPADRQTLLRYLAQRRAALEDGVGLWL